MRPDFTAIDRYDVSTFRIDGLALSVSDPEPRVYTSGGFAKSGPMCVTVRVHMRVRDRDTGEPREIIFGRAVTAAQWAHPKKQARAVRAAVQAALIHEARECLLVEGERVFDPIEEHPPVVQP